MSLSLEALLPYVVFLSITLAVWAVLSALADRKRGAEDRLSRIMNPARGSREAGEHAALRQEKFQDQVTKAANKLGQSLRPSDEQELGKVRLKLLNAGLRSENAVAVFFGVKLILMLVGLGIAFPIAALKFGMSRNTLTLSVMAGTRLAAL